MQVINAQQIQQAINNLPDIPENHAAFQALMQLRDAAAVETKPFTFELDFAGVVAGGQSAPQNFNVDMLGPFLMVQMNYQADIAAAARTRGTNPVPNMTVAISDGSANRNWQNAAVPIPSIFGDGQQPYFLPQPFLLPGGSVLTAQVFSYEAVNTMNVRLSFIGLRYYS